MGSVVSSDYVESFSKASRESVQSLDAQFVQQSAQPSASLADSSVDQRKKKEIDENTNTFLKELSNNKKNIQFTEIRGFCRPIQLNQHNVNGANDDDEKENKSNAIRGAKGWHHVLCILTDENGMEYVCDKQESVRFGKVNAQITKQLTSGHLKQIFCNKVKLTSSELVPFIKKQRNVSYNAVNRNCINFLYDLVSDLLPEMNEWKNKDKFWAFTKAKFDKKEIEKGQYNKQQNDYKQLIMEKTKKLLQKLKEPGANVVFEEIDFYVRGIEVIFVLTDNNDQKYLCDARNYVRFSTISNRVLKKLLIEYGLRMVSSDEIWIKAKDFCEFVEKDLNRAEKRNSLNFASYVASKLLKIPKWKDINAFVAFIKKQ